jgi:solute carrier family 29 (equilibrative nucleoside transporter), member 1/2/3
LPKNIPLLAMIALYLLYGVALLLPWNVYSKALPYFQSILPAYSTILPGLATFSLQASNFIAVLFIIFFPIPRRLLKWTVLGALLFQSLLVVFAYLVKYLPYLAYLLLVLISSGVTGALLQTSLYALLLPHVNAAPWFQAGQALAGLVVSVSTVFLTSNKDNDLLGIRLYFGLTISLLMTTLVASATLEKGWHDVADSTDPKPASLDTSILSSLWPTFASIACCLAFTLFVFPSLFLSATSSTGNLLFLPLTFITYDAGDLIGKLFPTIYRVTNRKVIVVLPFLRLLLFIPMIITNIRGSPIQSDWFYFVLVALFAVTQGYFLTILIASLCGSAKDERSASSLGLLVSLSICVGAALGSGASMAMPWIISTLNGGSHL